MVEVSKFRSFSVGDYQRGKDLNFDTFTVYEPKPDKTDREPDESPSTDNDACTYQNLLKFQSHKPTDEIQRSLEQSSLSLNDDLVISVLQRHRSDWKPAYVFFNWVSGGRNGSEHFPGSDAYNEILDILGRMNRFQELTQVFDKMRKRNIVNERTYAIMLNRYAAAYKVEEAIEFFNKRKELGLEPNLVAFRTLLMCLCRYKHIEAAEFLFHSRQNEFPIKIKTMNIILNGWCVLGSLREAKRLRKDIVSPGKCKPDRFTYGTFIYLLTKAGKATTALKLFRAIWEMGCDPDVTICCLPNVATYNTLIKHLRKIRRKEKVYELLDEMEQKGGSCLPNASTYGFLLKSGKNAKEVPVILLKMERIKIMIHGHCDKGRIEEATYYFNEMTSKGMVPEPRIKILVDAMNIKLKERLGELRDTGVMKRDMRYAAAHKVEEAIEFFNKRKELGLEPNLVAFRALLMCLCRYKHIETAEFLFHSRQNEFPIKIKTMNIILNGWCVLGSLRETKRLWKDIVSPGKCKTDRFTYGTFINLLTKVGKATTALKLFRTIWEMGCDPDVTICNCVIDGLCFKKRIPEALAIFQEMNERGCLLNVATYNTLIKHLRKIRRMEKVYELLDEMEQKGGSCLPNASTYGFLLKSAKNAEEVPVILLRMERIGSKLTDDTYNLLLRLFMD
ncbi:hypothetical protein RHGRI_018388 [Rhododendron griersonianum]|uniref:Pentatricopeptide repeat-containing protein n=1 Tax=Rhododendron griersonianum TaxID=479676 RepID=A0AAV6K196_9ERIC|nr:hypothetical protein RHGRI_018388 [Rhododendron griersonianum]